MARQFLTGQLCCHSGDKALPDDYGSALFTFELLLQAPGLESGSTMAIGPGVPLGPRPAPSLATRCAGAAER
jgi:hypothetical protein